LFNLDAMTTICQILSPASVGHDVSRDGTDNLWTYDLADGRGIKKAVAFLFPYIADKKKWSHKPDVMYHAEWPMRHPSLLFAGFALGEQRYLELWKKLPADSTVEEVIRNFFVRQPLLWVEPTS
ncbi:MAG: alginate lyase family protein, partial [Vicinamibacterales bacterium]